MYESTRKYFSNQFIKNNNFNFSTVVILSDIYSWIFSSNNPPKKKIFENRVYFFISQSHLVRLNNGLISQPTMNLIFKKIKESGIISDSKLDNNQNYILFDWDKVKESLLKDEEMENKYSNNWFDNVDRFIQEQINLENKLKKKSYNKNEEETEMRLFDDDIFPEEKSSKIPYSETAYQLAIKIIEKCRKENKKYFSHKYKEYGEEQTKLFTQACNSIQALYNGNFINPRIHPLSEKFKTNAQFNIDFEQVKTKLSEVEGDWNKVKKLILFALSNFDLMHQNEYVPCDKKYLLSGLNDWFYAMSFEEAGKFQSQFMQCLFEPMKTPEFYSEKKADNIYDTLSKNVKISGNKLFEMNTSMNPGTFWEKIKEMVEWAKLVMTSDENAHYWIDSPGDIINKFADWCEKREISISVSTLDISKSFDCNAPFAWFVQEAIENHGLNRQLTSCVKADDFTDCYNKDSGAISFDDMEEIPVF